VSFVIGCPNCGSRGVYEFRFGGERRQRPLPQASDKKWTDFVYNRDNLSGVQEEWWYHRDGCGKWFLAERDTSCNQVKAAYWAKEPVQ
jgi:heterotetrameric sarcosine oxidase delta subunit